MPGPPLAEEPHVLSPTSPIRRRVNGRIKGSSAAETQPNLRQLAKVVGTPAEPEVIERRRRALVELAASLRPNASTPLWAIVARPRPVSEHEYMALLRALTQHAGLSFGAIASQTERNPDIESVPKSTVHSVLKRNSLPRRVDQLRALLVVLTEANGGTDDDVSDMLELRDELLSTRTTSEPVPESTGDPPAESNPAGEKLPRDPMEVARAIRHILWTITSVAVMIMTAIHYYFEIFP